MPIAHRAQRTHLLNPDGPESVSPGFCLQSPSPSPKHTLEVLYSLKHPESSVGDGLEHTTHAEDARLIFPDVWTRSCTLASIVYVAFVFIPKSTLFMKSTDSTETKESHLQLLSATQLCLLATLPNPHPTHSYHLEERKGRQEEGRACPLGEGREMQLRAP